MDREGFRNRLKQYKKAREENPGLKYWEWKDIPKYDEGTDGVRDNTYVAPIEKELVFILATGTTKLKLDILNKLTRNGQIKSGALEIVSPEFEILSGGIGIPRLLYENRITNLAKSLVSELSDKTISKGAAKIKPHFQLHTPIGETFTVSEDAAKELSAMYRRNISSETAAVLSVLGKKRTPSRIQFNLNASEREWLRKHNVDETILSGKDIKTLKQLRRQSIIDAIPINERFILTSPTAEHSQLQLFKNTLNKPTQIGYIDYGTDPYSYMRYLGRNLLPISDIDLTNHVTVDMIENISNKYFDDLVVEKGVSKDLYNGLAHVMKQRFPENGGFVTGMKLISPEPTTKTLNKLNKSLISNLGEYHWATGSTLDNPIYSITNTTGDYPVVKSLLFDPKAIKNGKIITDLTNPDIHFAEGGEVEPDPLEVLERSKPKIAGVPINDKPLSGTDPIGEAMMWGLGGGAASVALRSLFPTYGATAGWLAFGDNNKENVLIVPNNVNKSKLPVAKDLVNYDVKEFFENDVVPRDVIYPIESKQSFLNDANFMYDIYPESHFELNVAGYYDNINKKVVVNNLYAGDLKSINRIGTHEFGHKYNDQFELDDPHKRILNNAYTVEENKIGRTARGARRTNEKRETNKNIRYDMYVELLKKLGRSPSPSEVDDFIDSLSDREILRRVRNSNMYGSAYFESINERAQRIKQPIGTYTRTRASKIRKALKQVAMNERSKDNQNYA